MPTVELAYQRKIAHLENKVAELEERLEESASKMQILLDHLPLVFYQYDDDGLVEILQGEGIQQQAKGKSYSILQQIHKNLPSLLTEIKQKTVGTVFEENTEVGKNIWYTNVYTALQSEKKEITGVIGLAMDVSILYQTQKDLADKKVDIAFFNKAAYHDLKEPLRLINSYAQLLQRKAVSALSEEHHRYLNIISKNVKKMGNLINGIAVYLDQTTLENEPIFPSEIISEITDDLKNQYPKKNITVHCQPNAIPALSSSYPLLLLLFQNILSNAIKFNRNENVAIVINYEQKNGQHLFSIQDNGIGIDHKYIKKVFDPFQRLNGGSEFEGVGLGLAFCRKKLEQVGGQIWFTSELDKGSTFYWQISIH